MNGIGFREWVTDDEDFVRDSWVESFRSSHYAGMAPMDEYGPMQHRWIQRIVDRPGVTVRVAFNEEYPDQLFGFVCTEDGFTLPMVHYMYVKEDFRRLAQKDKTFRYGIATQLLLNARVDPRDPFYYTHKTVKWVSLVRNNGPFGGGVYRPLLARFSKESAVEFERKNSAALKKPLRRVPEVEYR